MTYQTRGAAWGSWGEGRPQAHAWGSGGSCLLIKGPGRTCGFRPGFPWPRRCLMAQLTGGGGPRNPPPDIRPDSLAFWHRSHRPEGRSRQSLPSRGTRNHPGAQPQGVWEPGPAGTPLPCHSQVTSLGIGPGRPCPHTSKGTSTPRRRRGPSWKRQARLAEEPQGGMRGRSSGSPGTGRSPGAGVQADVCRGGACVSATEGRYVSREGFPAGDILRALLPLGPPCCASAGPQSHASFFGSSCRTRSAIGAKPRRTCDGVRGG